MRLRLRAERPARGLPWPWRSRQGRGCRLPRGASCRALVRGAGFPVCACLPPPIALAGLGQIAYREERWEVAEPCESEKDVPFVADRGGDLGCLGKHGGRLFRLSFGESHLGNVAER